MARQTFIICLEDKEGVTWDFERWAYKRLDTCINRMVDLYLTYSGLYFPNLEKAERVVAYPTPDGYHKAAPVWSVTVEEFKNLIKQREEELRNENR